MLVTLVDVERGAVGLDCAGVVRELGLLQERDRVQRPKALLWVRLVVERLAVELHTIGRPARLAQQPVDGLEAPGLRLRIERVGAPVEVEGAVDVLLRLEELARALRKPGGGGLVRRDLLELAGVDLGETPLGVGDARESLELSPRALVGRVLCEELRRRLQRGLVVLGLLLVQLREAAQEQPALVRILADVEARLERGHDAPPVEAREVHGLEHLGCARRVLSLPHQRLERCNRLRVLRVDRQRRGVLVERAVDFPGSLLEDCAERVMERRAPFVRRSRRRDLPLVERDEILPPLRLGIEALERLDGPRIERQLEDLLVDSRSPRARRRASRRRAGPA